MKLFLVLILLIGATSGVAENTRLPKPWPTALERFVNHRHTQIIQVHEAARLGDNEESVKVTGLVARNNQTHPSEMKGIRFVVSGQDTTDNVYLPLARALALKSRLVNLEDTAKYLVRGDTPLAVMGTEDCRPSLPLPRMHKLCIGLYQRHGESGLAISTGYTQLFLADVELADLVNSIDSALAAIENP